MSTIPTHRPARPMPTDFWALVAFAQLPVDQIRAMSERKAADDALAEREKAAKAGRAEIAAACEKHAADVAALDADRAKFAATVARHDAAVAKHGEAVAKHAADVKQLAERTRALAAREKAHDESAAPAAERDHALTAREVALAAREGKFERRFSAAKAILDAVPDATERAG